MPDSPIEDYILIILDGLVVPDMGSGETVEAWLGRLGLA
jgi:hypothetical protein